MTQGRRVTIEVEVDAPPDAAWRALREPAEVARWFGWEYDGLAAEIELIFFSDATASDAERRLETGDGIVEVEPARGTPASTVVRVTRAAPTGEAGEDAMYWAIEEGWITFVHQLGFMLERHPGEDRRTVYLSGGPGVGESHAPLDGLGLSAVVGEPTGSSYAATLPWGGELVGEVRFRSDCQVGLTVESWGDGLLVLTGPWTSRPAPDGAGAILTTYGLDDAAFSALEASWTAWWEDRYKGSPADGDPGEPSAEGVY